MQELRLAAIGSGMIVHAVLSHVKETPGVTLEAVYSRSRETGEALARECGCKKVYTSLEAMLLDPAVNTVYIASPNLLHFAQAKQALQAGKHVICEKPFVPTRAQAQTLINLAKEKGLLLAEAVPTPHLPNFPLLRKLLPEIGPIRLVLANYTQYSARYDKLRGGEKPNIFNPALAGGCLMDINFYNVYLNVALFGAPQSAAYYPNIYPGAADTSGVFVMQYASFISTNAGAKDARGKSFFTVEGERGSIEIENGANGLQRIHLLTAEKDEMLNEQPHPDRWYYEVCSLTKCFLDEDRETLDALLQTTLQTVTVMETARKNAGLRFPCDDSPQADG
ncbi:MAG: Gfo/Idh/MocA family oxidoreductase [Clostridia bacterium]|nr:Gfo/Idh/MocA family oxidoreductase [Clostridia bacterium]